MIKQLRQLPIEQQFQYAILIVLFLAWVTTMFVSLIVPEPTDFVVNLYGKLEAVFLTLASVQALSARISKFNGQDEITEVRNEKADTADTLIDK